MAVLVSKTIAEKLVDQWPALFDEMLSKRIVVMISKIDEVGCAEEMSVVQGLQMSSTCKGVRVE